MNDLYEPDAGLFLKSVESRRRFGVTLNFKTYTGRTLVLGSGFSASLFFLSLFTLKYHGYYGIFKIGEIIYIFFKVYAITFNNNNNNNEKYNNNNNNNNKNNNEMMIKIIIIFLIIIIIHISFIINIIRIIIIICY